MQKHTFDTLYKLSSTGKIQEWSIAVLDNPARYVVEYGQQDGKKQQTTVQVPVGKNIGKTNETTPYQQAVLEAKSKWYKQLDKGYISFFTSLTKSQIPRDTLVANMRMAKTYLPMLAKSYKGHAHRVKFPCAIQPKLDGIRCLAFKDQGNCVLLSRKGKQFLALPHIEAALLKNPLFQEGIVLDGELFTTENNFQELASMIKRDAPSDKSHLVEYHIYDTFKTPKDDRRFIDRYKWLHEFFKQNSQLSCLKLVKTIEIDEAEEVWTQHALFVQEGYEGAILRNFHGLYEQDRRSENLQKVKDFLDEEFEIIGAEENKGKFAGQCTFICKTKYGAEFGVKPMGDEALRRSYWKNHKKLIGKQLTVRFFEWSSSDKPVPRFPVGIGIRDYEG